MQLVPVLEIRHGKCVHTEPKNSYVDQVIKEDVMDVVENWVNLGIERIHLVDVDAVESGEPENVDIVGKIKLRYPHLTIQALGGIKTIDSAYVWIDGGIDFLVLNGRAIRQRHLLDDLCVEFPGQVLVELDSRQGYVGMGSGEPSFKLSSLAEQLSDDGVAGLVVTEVPNNGHVTSASLISTGALSQQIGLPVYANGGIQKIADLKNILESEKNNLSGILIGKAVHNGFCLREAADLIQQYQLNQKVS